MGEVRAVCEIIYVFCYALNVLCEVVHMLCSNKSAIVVLLEIKQI